MSYLVALPDGTNAEFPDNVTPEEAAKVISRQFPPAQKAEPSTLKTVGTNLLGGVAEAGLGFGAAVSPSEDLTKYLDKKREEVRQWQKENGGDTLAGMAASGAGTMAPALGIEALGAAAAPVTGGASLLLANLANAGFFGIPAFRDTYNAQKEAGASTGVALQHAFAEAGMATIGGKIIGSGGKILPKALQAGEGVLGKMGMAAAEGAAFPEASRVLEKGIDVANDRQNDKSWLVDPKEAAAGALSFAGLRGVHHAMEAPQRAEAAKQQAAADAEAKTAAETKAAADAKAAEDAKAAAAQQADLDAQRNVPSVTAASESGEMTAEEARDAMNKAIADHAEAVQRAGEAARNGDFDTLKQARAEAEQHTKTIRELQQFAAPEQEAPPTPRTLTPEEMTQELVSLNGYTTKKGNPVPGKIEKALRLGEHDAADAHIARAEQLQQMLDQHTAQQEALARSTEAAKQRAAQLASEEGSEVVPTVKPPKPVKAEAPQPPVESAGALKGPTREQMWREQNEREAKEAQAEKDRQAAEEAAANAPPEPLTPVTVHDPAGVRTGYVPTDSQAARDIKAGEKSRKEQEFLERQQGTMTTPTGTAVPTHVVSFQGQREMRQHIADAPAKEKAWQDRIDEIDEGGHYIPDAMKDQYAKERASLVTRINTSKRLTAHYTDVMSADTAALKKLDDRIATIQKRIDKLSGSEKGGREEPGISDKLRNSRQDQLTRAKKAMDQAQKARMGKRGIEITEKNAPKEAQEYEAVNTADARDRLAVIEEELKTAKGKDRKNLLQERVEMTMLANQKLPPRKLGPVTRKEVVAGEQRTGTEESKKGENKTGTKNPVQEPTRTRWATPKEAVTEGNKVSAEVAARNKAEAEAKAKAEKAATDKLKKSRKGLESARKARAVENVYADDIFADDGDIGDLGFGGWEGEHESVLFRSEAKGPAGMDKGVVQRVVDATTKGWKNTPDVVVVQNESELPLRMQGRIRLHKEGGEGRRVPGLYDSKTGKVFLIADDIRDAHDAHVTILHEIAGHRGLQGLLGDKYAETMQRLEAGNKDVAEKTKQQMEKDPTISREQAVEEVLADMAEEHPEYSAVKRFYYAVKAAIYKAFGVKNVSDGEVRQIVANARRFIERGPGGGGGGGVDATLLRSKPAQNAAEAFGRQYTDERGKLAKLNASKSHLGLAVEQAVVDMRASLRRALMLGDKKLGTQALYDLSNTDDLTSMVRAVLSNGGFKITKDSKNYDQVTSGHSASFVDVTKAISAIPGGDARAKTNTFYGGMMALRGMKVGWDKLNFKDPVQAEKDGRAALAAINADPKMKVAFDKAKDTYNEFNRGLVQFAKDTHALPEAVANAMLADKEYVPFYRVNGDSIEVLMPDGHPISLGDIRSQPFLHSLVGGDQKLMPFEDAAFKNAGVLTGLAMRNLSSKRIAYALQDLGSKAGVMQIQRGKGGAGQDVMRFRQAPMRPTGEKLQELNKAIAEKMEQREAAEKALDNGGSAAQVKELERTKAELDALLAKRNGSDDDGWRHIVIDTKGTAAEYIPTELLAQSVAGSYATLPSFLKVAGWASDILRSGVTRMPTYLVSQAIKDPFNAAMLGNLKANPVAAAIKTIGNFTGNLTGKSADAQALAKMGVLHSQVFNGTPEDMKKVYMQIAGKNQGAFSRFMAGLDHAAMTADAATREQHYRDVLNSGGSEVEAALGAREMQNFTKRGSSSTMQMITRMIPFFNAQIQGLNVMAKSAQGKMGTSELLDSKNKFYARAMGLAGMAFTYAMMMEDDPDWQKMSLRDKVNYIHFPKWLSPTDEPLRFPAPFETGMAFYSLPVAIVESMRNDFSPEDWKTVRELFANQLPGNGSIMPQLFKGTYDVSRNYNSGTGMPIEPKGMEHLSPEERYNQRTTEAAKAMSKHLVDMGVKLSPMQIEYLSNAYLGQFPQAVATMTNQAFADASKGEKPTGHASDTPLIGRFFQGNRTNDDVSHVYEQANASIEAKDTYTKKLKDGRSAEALAYFEQHKKDIALAPAMQKFQTALRNLAKAEQAVTNSPDMSGADKQEKLDRLREAKQTIAKQYRAAVQNVGAALQ